MANYKKLSELQLFERISKYDSRAIEELYNRYSEILFSLIKKIVKDNSAAEDLLAEVFLIIWKNASKINFSKTSCFTWIVTLTRNRATDYIKRQRGYEKNIPIYDESFESEFIIPFLDNKIDPLDSETAQNIKPKIIDAYQNLTDAQKFVINLAFFDGFSIEEIAETLKIPVETVRSKVMTALFNLRENLLSGE